MPRRPHILQELGFAVRPDGEELHGTASVTPYMQVPDVPCLRASILASWADMLLGMLSMRAFTRVSVTLELDVHLYRPAPGSGTVTAVGRPVKAGRSVFVGEVEFADSDGETFGFSAASFMAAPDTTLRPPRLTSLEVPPQEEVRLRMPLAERADCKRQAPGMAVLHKCEDGLNAAKTVHGGLIALAAEEAALSLAPGTSLSSLALRYLQPVRTGPAVATASVRDGLGRVELRDSGNGNRLAVTATTRTF
jgi:acyl-coenzyme A thioesterase PaaI-like protein